MRTLRPAVPADDADGEVLHGVVPHEGQHGTIGRAEAADAAEGRGLTMATGPNDPIRRVVEEEEMVAPRGEDAEPSVEPDGDDSAGEVGDRG